VSKKAKNFNGTGSLIFRRHAQNPYKLQSAVELEA